MTLADVRGEDDFDRDGLTNLEEFLAGTLAFQADGTPPVTLHLTVDQAGEVTLFFDAVSGGRYFVESSLDLLNWSSVPFGVAGQVGNYSEGQPSQASVAGPLMVVPDVQANAEEKRFFRVVSLP